MEQYSNCRSGIVDFVIEIGTSLRYSLRLSFGSLANFQATDILNSRSPNALVEKSSLHVSRENESVSRVTIQEGGGGGGVPLGTSDSDTGRAENEMEWKRSSSNPRK